jgi:hypothetical protein
MAVLLSLLFAAEAQSEAQKSAFSPEGSPNVASRIQNARENKNIFREIVDPHNGARWVLLRDVAHPTGPGRLVQATPDSEPGAQEKPGEARELMFEVGTPCIHAGEKVVVEEHTATVDVSLQAVAMEPARMGSSLRVRLNIGGKVVRTVALAPGKAALAPAAGGVER